jgi:hypothetical protein
MIFLPFSNFYRTTTGRAAACAEGTVGRVDALTWPDGSGGEYVSEAETPRPIKPAKPVKPAKQSLTCEDPNRFRRFDRFRRFSSAPMMANR